MLQSAFFASGALGMAHLSAVPYEPMMRGGPIFLGNRLHEPLLHFGGRLARSQPQTVGNAEYVRIYRDRIAVEGNGVDHVRRLSAHARKRLQFLLRGGYFAAETLQNILRGGKNVLRLIPVKSAGKNLSFEFLLRKGEHLFGRVVFFKKLRSHFIHPFVRALRRQNDGDEQFVGRTVQERGAGAEIQPFELL